MRTDLALAVERAKIAMIELLDQSENLEEISEVTIILTLDVKWLCVQILMQLTTRCRFYRGVS